MVFVMMNSRYICIRQRYLLEQLSRVNRKMQQISSKNRLNKEYVYRYLKESFRLNSDSMQICRHIKIIGHFWSPFLSTMFSYYIFVICYLIYLTMFKKQLTIKESYVFICLLLQMAMLVILVIQQCSMVVTLNQQIMVENRKFFNNYFRNSFQRQRQNKIIFLKV